MLFSHLIWIDYLLILFVLITMVICYRKGFVHGPLTLVCWIVAIGGAFKLSHPMGTVFENSIRSEYVRNIVGFFIVFILLALIGVLIVYMFNHLVEKAYLQKTDQLVGGIAGIVVGIFLISGLLLLGRYSTLPTKPFWTKSYLIPYFYPFEDVINDLLPVSIQAERDIIPSDIDKKLDNVMNNANDVVQQTGDKIQDHVEAVQDKTSDVLAR